MEGEGEKGVGRGGREWEGVAERGRGGRRWKGFLRGGGGKEGRGWKEVRDI